MRNFSILFITIIILLVSLSCDDSSPTKSKLDLSVTPMENEEAELAAMWLSGELVAPVRLYERIRDDLFLIRSTWIDSIPEVAVEYTPWRIPGYLNLWFEQTTFDSIISGDYHSWDSLNNYYRGQISYIETRKGRICLSFEGRFNPSILAIPYRELDGISGVGGIYTPYSDYPMLLIYRLGNIHKYIFRDAWGDCPSGCIYSTFHYFEIENGNAVHKGSWYPEHPPPEDGWDPPKWMDIYQKALNNYYSPF